MLVESTPGAAHASTVASLVVIIQEDIERRLEEGLNSSDPVDFEDLLRTKPDEVISYLAKKGTQKLGSFITEVSLVSVADQKRGLSI